MQNLEDLGKKEDQGETAAPIKENLNVVKELMKDEECKEQLLENGLKDQIVDLLEK